jgi:hypothetical protein
VAHCGGLGDHRWRSSCTCRRRHNRFSVMQNELKGHKDRVSSL